MMSPATRLSDDQSPPPAHFPTNFLAELFADGRFDCRCSLPDVQVELEAVFDAPENHSPNRHVKKWVNQAMICTNIYLTICRDFEIILSNQQKGSRSVNMKKSIVASFVIAGLAGFSAIGETWYWSPTSGSNWTEPKNWLNSSNERGVGYPNTGDTAVLGDTSSSSGTACYAPDGSSRKLYELRIGPGKVVTMNQGDYGFQAGGKGFQYLAASGATGNWGGMRFGGNGDVPINISNNVQFAMQMRMNVDSGTPALVKEGQGEFICYNQNGSSFNLKEVRVKQGAIDCSMDSGTINDCRFMFDGNDSSQRFTMGYANHKGLNLNNCGLYETNGVANAEHGFDDRGKNFQVTFTGTQKLNPTVFSGRFYNKAGIKWSPSAADAVFVCSNGVSDTAGIITVAKGTVRLVTGASFTALAELQVAAGATFEVADAPSVAFSTSVLTLSDATAKVKVGENVNIAFTTGTLAGKALKPGVYSAVGGEGLRTATWIEGDGTVTIVDGPTNSDTWTGGAAGGTSALLGGNWESGEDPDLASGSFFATFAAGGTEASLPADTEAKFDGVILERTSGNAAFAFSAAAGASATIGGNGFKGLSAAATTWNMAWPLVLGAAQSWTIGANDSLVVAGGLSGTEPLTLDGAGAVTFASESTHSGALNLNSGTVRVTASNGLGTSARRVDFANDKVALSFAGDISIDSPIYGKTSGPDNGNNGFTIEPNANVVFNGEVRQYSLGGRITVGAGATVTFKGGYAQDTSGMTSSICPRGSGTIIVEGKPMTSGFRLECATDNPVTLDFRVAGNNLKVARDYNWSLFTGPLYTRVANAFAARQWIQLRGSTAFFDLCGNNQSVMLLHGESGTRVTSATPATLTVTSEVMNEYQDYTQTGDTNRVDLAVFEGAVNFKKTGPVIHTFGATSTSTGSVEVTQGPLVFNANGKWPDCSAVKVTGGILDIRNADAFGDVTRTSHGKPQAIWTVSSAAKVKLNFDGVIKCRQLFIDGVKSYGTFGAADSSAQYKCEWVEGTGCLFALQSSLAVILR